MVTNLFVYGFIAMILLFVALVLVAGFGFIALIIHAVLVAPLIRLLHRNNV